MENRNRYRGRISLHAFVRLGFIVILLGAVGVFVVTIRNRHVLKGEEIRRVEVKIATLSQEIEMWELRIASVKDRNELKRRLRWVGSSLKEIEASEIFRLPSNSGVSPIAGVF